MDDEKVAYKGYERMLTAGVKNVCVHKGLFAPGVEKEFPHLRGFVDAADVGQAAKDWSAQEGTRFELSGAGVIAIMPLRLRAFRSARAPSR